MRTLRNFLISIAILASLYVLPVSAQNFAPGRPVNTLERQIFKKINSLPYYGVFDFISFEVNGGAVTLHGKVASLGTKKDAERAVRRIPGVTSVENRIVNLPPSSFDAAIRRDIVREFVRAPGLYPYLREPNPSVRIIVENGRVSLEGYVPNRGTSNLMYSIARTVPGTFEVTNHLIIGSGRDR